MSELIRHTRSKAIMGYLKAEAALASIKRIAAKKRYGQDWIQFALLAGIAVVVLGVALVFLWPKIQGLIQNAGNSVQGAQDVSGGVQFH